MKNLPSPDDLESRLEKIRFRQALARGFKKLCPRCGQAKIYQGWYRLRQKCPTCGRVILQDPVDILAFVYISTALITGIIILLMFVLVPKLLCFGRILLGLGALSAMVFSLPYRKSLAIAFDYYTEVHWTEENILKDKKD